MGFRQYMEGTVAAKAKEYGENLAKNMKYLEDHMITIQQNQKELFDMMKEIKDDIKNIKTKLR